ncbi:uncharacterized protein TNCT_728091 [Trichonephila clavata]|uniref:Uncharacterized protein n=1 Tax=Trichonephila clavata TaxID=2740835 RepID=A0A8X6GEP1_TRICU|nr:uncharacterized protein TNCT_728091 [Trichonephila clavata]
MIRILDWVKRFTKNCQKKVINQESFLSVDEVQDSRGTLQLLPADSFPETGGSIKGLLTMRNQSGLRRVKTKIIERDDSYAFRYPVSLPSRHYIVDCLIRDYHLVSLTLDFIYCPGKWSLSVDGFEQMGVYYFWNLHQCRVDTLIVLGVEV